jgi:hypothetical protein
MVGIFTKSALFQFRVLSDIFITDKLTLGSGFYLDIRLKEVQRPIDNLSVRSSSSISYIRSKGEMMSNQAATKGMPVSNRELTAEQIWEVQPGERRSVGVIHIVITALLIGIGFVVGAFGSISFPLGFGVNFFWTGIAVQQVGSIWFGGCSRFSPTPSLERRSMCLPPTSPPILYRRSCRPGSSAASNLTLA